MFHCVVCGDKNVLSDDIALSHEDGDGRRDGRVVCVDCYRRQTDTAKPLDKHLRESIQAILAGVEG